jgi:Fe-S-cluster containining protein
MHPFLEKIDQETGNELRSAKNRQDLKAVYSNVHKWTDEAFNSELSRSGMTIACCAGCYYCCYLKVDVQPGEIFLIADFVRNRFPEVRRIKILNKAKENWKKIEPLTSEQHLNAALPCPLLEEGKCSVYSVRPNACRQAHSMRAEPCKKFVENPETSEEFAELITNVKAATSIISLGTSIAFEKAGYDSQPYDLNAALIQALENPRAEKRWWDKKQAFPNIMVAKDWPKGKKSLDILAHKSFP